MKLFVMLPIIDTQHMTCFENFTKIMDVKSMIIDQSCVTAGLYTAKFYGWLKILIFKKSLNMQVRGYFCLLYIEIV